jgi:PhnB protein
MKQVTTYLQFDGNCREAMTFYEKSLGAELMMFPYSEAPGDLGKDAQDRIMHARLSKGGETLLMASDVPPGMPLHHGDNFYVSVSCESMQEIQRLFTVFSEKGKVKMELQDTFWGAHFGMLTDQFGINWMFDFELPKKE